VWFQDEAHIGQKNKITRRWAKRGTRPVAPQDQRTASAYIFGTICPQDGKGAALVLPRCDIAAMTLPLAEIATRVAPGAHAVLPCDQAGWHLSERVVVPANITVLPLPAKCPELNSVENIWQFMRENWLSNRVFDSYKNIVGSREYQEFRARLGVWVLISGIGYYALAGVYQSGNLFAM
jgi:hypothetical protein